MTEIKLLCFFIATICFGLTSCEESIKPINHQKQEKNINPFDRPGSVYILSEGNLSSENGSLVYISPDGNIIDNLCMDTIFYGKSNITQDLFIKNDTLYIISQNNGLYLYNTKTLELLDNINLDDNISTPVNIAVFDSENVILRSIEKVGSYNIKRKTWRNISNQRSPYGSPRIFMYNEIAYIPIGTKLGVINKEDQTISNEISFENQISGISKAKDGHLYVSTYNPISRDTKIYDVNISNIDNVEKNELTTVSNVTQYLKLSSIDSKGDSIYIVRTIDNAPTISRYIVSNDELSNLGTITNDNANSKIVYGNLGINPYDGMIYITTIKGYGLDYRTNSILEYDVSGSNAILKAHYDNKIFFPAGVYFRDKF